MKKFKIHLTASSVVIILPIIIGLILWDKLPDTIATHFNRQMEPDGYSSKAFFVFGLPLIMLAVHCVCAVATMYDPKRSNLSDAVIKVFLWIVPVISLFVAFLCYSKTFGADFNIGITVDMLVGIIIAVIAVYLPRLGQNHTIGIKLPWTLSDEENWNKTHKFAGIVWFVCGLAIIANSLILSTALFVTAIAVMVLAPAVYSFVLYKKKNR